VQINPDSFPTDMAADVPKSVTHFMAISKVPLQPPSLAPSERCHPGKRNQASQ